MDSDVQALLALEPTSASQSDDQDAVDSIQSDWDDTEERRLQPRERRHEHARQRLGRLQVSRRRRARRRVGLRRAERRGDGCDSPLPPRSSRPSTGLTALPSRGTPGFPCRPVRGPAGIGSLRASDRGSPGMNHRSKPEGSSFDPRVLPRASDINLCGPRPSRPRCSLTHRVRIHRGAATWSRATATRAGDWAREARKDHASVESASDPSSATAASRRWCSPAASPTASSSGCSRCRSSSGPCSGGSLIPSDVESTLKQHGIGALGCRRGRQRRALSRGAASGGCCWSARGSCSGPGYTCTKALVLAHAAIWQPPASEGNAAVSGHRWSSTASRSASSLPLAAARWIREDHSSTGFAATLFVYRGAVRVLAGGRLELCRTGRASGSNSCQAPWSSPLGCRRCISSRPISSARN